MSKKPCFLQDNQRMPFQMFVHKVWQFCAFFIILVFDNVERAITQNVTYSEKEGKHKITDIENATLS